LTKIYCSIAFNYDIDLISASLPILEHSKVDAIEWSFDTLSKFKEIPDWFFDLLRAFGNQNKLIGHGVFFSLLSGKWSEEQISWIEHLKKVSSSFKFDHVTEHFGFMSGQNFHYGAPLPCPYSPTTLRIGQDRLKRIYDACQCPVGIENLAFSYSIEDVKQHGEFLSQLIEPINGFIILDLHNLYCQIHNFNVPWDDIIKLYPLEKVREIHISGGSWVDSKIEPNRKIRRDTHDKHVPEEVFALLKKSITICPNLKYVVLEQLGMALKDQESKTIFQDDFLKMKEAVQDAQTIKPEGLLDPFLPLLPITLGPLVEDELLYLQQLEISKILENALDYEDAARSIINSSLHDTDWKVAEWQPAMIETAIEIAQKWKKKN